jgi:putative hydrolase of the HAD superfamily
MFPFDVILFDVGGVLLTNGWDHRERAAAIAHFGLDLPAFEARHATQNDAWERDLIPVERYLDETIFYEPRAFSQDEFIACMLSQSKIIPESALGILAELAASNLCLLGALNNEARVTNDYRFETFGLRDRFQIALSSCYVGLRKPHTAIYRRALDIVGAPPQRILFIDDRQENVDAAAAVGMKTIRFQGAHALRAELVRMEVLS